MRGRRRDRGRPLARLVLAGLGLVAVLLGAGAALAAWRGGDTGDSGATTTADVITASPVAPSPEPPSPEPPPSSPPPSGPAEEESPEATPHVPASGPGTFTTARAHGDPVGKGPLRRYRVQVENGIDISAKDAAAEIERILAHPRGWAAHGRGSFQLVSANADFVIRIATPATADKLCGAQGLDTHGELNCETVDGVVVNLRRWVLGSPTFDGPAADYRHLIINHEVGHEIGLRRHLGCSGPGRPAPVMMQQIKGLDGCTSNAWPYDKNGKYITGPEL
ncbi:DUF3152 domain-containing protein [Streptomyces scopuliridis]|uniref:DUF3152 domain-containing protein n=1 Tax=Streptomyces scopuliridis TaxID=452529 RepID=A0ACD4ZLT5_9ACTN|nr:DUF3152 domain-containing protein [Streptomyces scopuliridis]WSB34507.1 DUF3152 domain-containing protein [Streptomyces scopuliridis]WSB98752.1 DUF3152 domain-containing protein [Streptomyces scopuliridis]WSC07545.1 DUF3152 domain-containing protein [Streptomyces scopuliridis]